MTSRKKESVNRFKMQEQILAAQTVATEIDLRYEVSEFFNGNELEIPKAYTVLLRRMRYEDNGTRVKCHCNVNGEGVSHKPCSNCKGEGYVWDEQFVHSFKVEKDKNKQVDKSGGANNKSARFYFEYDIDINVYDKIIELAIDNEGNPLKPLRRGEIWLIKQIDHKRSDQGRTEYVLVECSLETNVKVSGRKRSR